MTEYSCPFCGRIALQSVCLECGTKTIEIVPAVESRPFIPVSIAELVDIEGFDPLTTFNDFSKLLLLAYHHKIIYHAAIIRIYAAETPLSELTVHQIVSAIYAAAEEQSK
jgi:hypothetical protein